MKKLLTIIALATLLAFNASIAFAGGAIDDAPISLHSLGDGIPSPSPGSGPDSIAPSGGDGGDSGGDSSLPEYLDKAAEDTFSLSGLRLDQQEDGYFEDTGDGTSVAENFIIRIINLLMRLIGSIALLLIVIAGVMMITSPGNENQRSRATEILQGAIIALVLAFSSFIIVNFVQGLFF